jgi:hypothetical protein
MKSNGKSILGSGLFRPMPAPWCPTQGSTALSHTDDREDYPYPIINFFIFPTALRSARIYAISILEPTISVNSPKEYV